MQMLREMAGQRGFFLRREAIVLGVDDRTLHRAVRQGSLVRIRQGAYCPADVWRDLSSEGRHLARAHASHDLVEGSAALSHVSALADYDCPLWQAPLEPVHLTRMDCGSSRLEAGVVHHRGVLREEEVIKRNGRWVTSPTRSLLDALTLMDMPSGIVAGDWMLRQGLTTAEDLWAGKQSMVRWPKTLGLEVTLRLLDGDSQSVGESLERHLLWRMHLPKPLLQYHVYGRNGRLIGITDFAWPEYGVYGEFDGKVKYGRLLKPGQDPGEVVFAEKRREDLIRGATDGVMVRHTWVDLHPHSEPSLRLQDLLRDGLTA
jgi:hypothetical protein